MICNISYKDRVTRVFFGVIFIIVSFFNYDINIIKILSIILVIEGLIGWCGIAVIIDKFKRN